MTILWSCSYNSFVKFDNKKILEPFMAHYIPVYMMMLYLNLCYNKPRCVIKGLNCMYLIVSHKAGLFQAILGKGPWPKLGKNDRLNIKIGRN